LIVGKSRDLGIRAERASVMAEPAVTLECAHTEAVTVKSRRLAARGRGLFDLRRDHGRGRLGSGKTVRQQRSHEFLHIAGGAEKAARR
jgi:hypothetical protein